MTSTRPCAAAPPEAAPLRPSLTWSALLPPRLAFWPSRCCQLRRRMQEEEAVARSMVGGTNTGATAATASTTAHEARSSSVPGRGGGVTRTGTIRGHTFHHRSSRRHPCTSSSLRRRRTGTIAKTRLGTTPPCRSVRLSGSGYCPSLGVESKGADAGRGLGRGELPELMEDRLRDPVLRELRVGR